MNIPHPLELHAAIDGKTIQTRIEDKSDWYVLLYGGEPSDRVHHILGYPDHQYRIAPETLRIVVGDVENVVDAPYRGEMKKEQEYWVADPGEERGTECAGCGVRWAGDPIDHRWHAAGLIHLTEAAAQRHGRALRGEQL